MADFSKYTNYDEHAGVSGVVFGSKSSVLEVEMNEMQEVQKTMLRNTIHNLMGDGITDLSKIIYADGVLQVADQCAFSVGGYLVECTGLSVEMTSGTAYLQVWEETVAYTAELKKDGNQQSTETVSNYFKDARTPAETTRRKVVKYTLSTSQKSDALNLAVASVADGKMKKLCREVNMAKLTDKVIDLQVQIGTLGEGVLGVEVDLENNTVKRLGESETWSAGEDFNQSPIYGERKRCNMTADGKIVAFYGDEAYTETGKLTTAVTGSNGVTYAIGTVVDAMVIQPAYYYKRIPLKVVKQTDSTYSVKGYHMMKWIDLISPTYKEGYKLHPAFKMGAENNSYYLIGENEGCISHNGVIDVNDTDNGTNSTFRSVAGAKPSSGTTKGGNKNLTRDTIRQMCAEQNNIQRDFTISSSEQMLFLIEYATFNAQELTDVFGEGVTNMPYTNDVNDSVPNPVNTTLGNGSGKIEVNYNHSNGTAYTLYVPVYRGVKNFFGNIWEFVDAFLRKHSASSDCNEAYWQDGSKAFSDAIAGYKPCGFSCATHEGYIKAFGYSEDCDFAYMTSLTGGDSSKPVGDYYWVNMGTNNVYIALLGARWADGLQAGLFCWALADVASDRSYTFGGRLCRKKAVTIVAPSANVA